jgi:hypothetical protein
VTVARPAPIPAKKVAHTAPPVDRERLPFEQLPEDHDDAADDPNALYGLADAEAAAAQAAAQDDRVLCPKCMHVIPRGVALCANCGHDPSVALPPPPLPSQSAGTEETEGEGSWLKRPSLGRGILFCVGASVLASFVWLMIAYGTRGDRYFLAILVGAAAGVGMKTGFKDESLPAGFIAAGVTVLISVIARTILIAAVLIPAHNRAERARVAHEKAVHEERQRLLDEQEAESRDPRAAHLLAAKELKSQGIDPERDYDDAGIRKKIADANDRAEKKVKEMPRSEYEKLLPPLEAEDIRQTLISQSLDPQLRKMGLNPDFQRIYPEQIEAAQKAVLESVNKMTPAQQRAELKKISPKVREEMASEKQRAADQFKLAPLPPHIPP